jgi:hypothetical protein
VTADPSAPVFLEIGQPKLKDKRRGSQVELYVALVPRETPEGRFRAVLIREEKKNDFGWMRDTDVVPATCNPR